MFVAFGLHRHSGESRRISLIPWVEKAWFPQFPQPGAAPFCDEKPSEFASSGCPVFHSICELAVPIEEIK